MPATLLKKPFQILTYKLSNSKDRFVADKLNEIDEAFEAAKTSFSSMDKVPLTKMDDLCSDVLFANKADTNNFLDGYLYRTYKPFFGASINQLPIKQKDAHTSLSSRNRRRFHETAEKIVTRYPDECRMEWGPYIAMCQVDPTLVHVWRDQPQKFNLFDTERLSQINRLTSPWTRSKDVAVGDFYIGGVKDDGKSPELPIAQQRQDGSIYYYFGNDHGAREWLEPQLHMSTRASGNHPDEVHREEQFKSFAPRAEFYFHVRHAMKDTHTIVLS